MNNPHNFDKHYLLLPSNVTLYPTEGRTKKNKIKLLWNIKNAQNFNTNITLFGGTGIL